MKESGRKTKCMAKEHCYGKTENDTRVNFSTINEQAMALFTG
jgi:hypothetical protein